MPCSSLLRRRLVFVGVGLLSGALQLACNTASSVRGEAPLTLLNNLPVVDVRVNNSTPLRMLLDTGAGTTVIDAAEAKKLQLIGTADVDVTTGGGAVAAASLTPVTLGFGGQTFADIPAVAIDLGSLSAGLGERIGGILGYDVFLQHAIEIDYQDVVVRLHDSSRYVVLPGAEVLPITLEEQIPFVLATIGGSAPTRLELDTGQSSPLTLVRRFVDAEGLIRPGQTSVAITAGALLPGQVPLMVTRVPRLQVGGFTLIDVIANVAPDEETAGVSAATAGILGGEFLKRFAVTVDYPRQRIVLRASDAGLGAATEFDMSGMSLAAQGPDLKVYRVRAVIPGSPAEQAGIRVGDELRHIDGEPAETVTLNRIRELLRREGRYSLVLRRGHEDVQATLQTRRLV